MYENNPRFSSNLHKLIKYLEVSIIGVTCIGIKTRKIYFGRGKEAINSLTW